MERDIVDFGYNAPHEAIGSELQVTLLDPTINVSRGQPVDFYITVNGKDRYLIKDGFVRGRTEGTGVKVQSSGRGAPNDTLTVVCRDRMGEKFTLAPRTPVILFDPNVVTITDGELDTNINDEDGERILAESRSTTDLDLIQALQVAYVEGMGFDEVITNIENFSLPRVDFPLQASYHDSIYGLYSMFAPVIFEDDGTLFILDIRAPLLEGMEENIRELDTSDYVSASRTKPDRNSVNAVLVSTNETGLQSIPDDLPGGVTIRAEPAETETSGSLLDGDFQQTTINRFTALLHEDEDEPDRVTKEVPFKVQRTMIGQDRNGVNRTLAQEEQIYLYEYSFRLETGYTRTINQYTDFPGELASIRQVLNETQSIQWEPTQIPGEFIKRTETFRTSGLVLVEGEGDNERLSALYELNRDNNVPEEGTIDTLPIQSRRRLYTELGPDQIEVSTQLTDHLSGKPALSSVQPHTGTIRANIFGSSGQAKKNEFLIVDEDGVEDDGFRAPLSFNAGYLDFPMAKELGARKLSEARNPPEQIEASLERKLDLSMRRGALRNVKNRAGGNKDIIVEGFQIDGAVKQTSSGRAVFEVGMSIQGRAL